MRGILININGNVYKLLRNGVTRMVDFKVGILGHNNGGETIPTEIGHNDPYIVSHGNCQALKVSETGLKIVTLKKGLHLALNPMDMWDTGVQKVLPKMKEFIELFGDKEDTNFNGGSIYSILADEGLHLICTNDYALVLAGYKLTEDYNGSPSGTHLFDSGDYDFIARGMDFVGLDANGNECTIPLGKFAEAI